MTTRDGLILLGVALLAAGCGKSAADWKEQLAAPDPGKRLHAVHAMQDKVGDPEVAIPALIGALKDEDHYVRRDAARALGQFGTAAAEAAGPLRALLRDKEPSVRKAAAAALEKVDPGGKRAAR